MGDAGITAAGVFVGSGVPVGSMTGIGVGAHAVRRRKAATMKFFIARNYMPLNVVARLPS
jgi:hypothetical protein